MNETNLRDSSSASSNPSLISSTTTNSSLSTTSSSTSLPYLKRIKEKDNRDNDRDKEKDRDKDRDFSPNIMTEAIMEMMKNICLLQMKVFGQDQEYNTESDEEI